MRQAVRAIVIKDDQLLVMYRNKFGNEYITLPGGHVEPGETHVGALNREMAEETQLKLAKPKLVFIEHAGDPWGDQYHFLCEYVSGEPYLSSDSEEHAINKLGKNIHQPGWLKLSDIKTLPFRSTELKKHITRAIRHGWPEKPLEFRSTIK